MTPSDHEYGVSACRWKDGRAGAVSLSYDDGYTVSYDDRLVLDAYGFKATYFVVGALSLRDDPPAYRMGAAQVQALYDAGHEIGCHAWYHWCDFYDRGDLAEFGATEYGAWFTWALANLDIPQQALRLAMAYPCGSRSEALDAVAAGYARSVRGYSSLNEDYPGRLVGLNTATPASPNGIMLVRVYSPEAVDQHGSSADFIKAAEENGLWAAVLTHGTFETWFLTYLASLDVWVAPQGEIVEYIRLRDSLEASAVAVKWNGRAHAVRFTIAAATGLDGEAYQGEISLQTAIALDDVVQGVRIDGTAVAWSEKVFGGSRYLIFDSGLSEHEVEIELMTAGAAGRLKKRRNAPCLGPTPTISGVTGPRTDQLGVLLLEGETVTIACTNARAVQGNGKLYWASSTDYATATKVECTIVTWSASSIVATMCAPGAATTGYFFIRTHTGKVSGASAAQNCLPRLYSWWGSAGASVPGTLTGTSHFNTFNAATDLTALGRAYNGGLADPKEAANQPADGHSALGYNTVAFSCTEVYAEVDYYPDLGGLTADAGDSMWVLNLIAGATNIMQVGPRYVAALQVGCRYLNPGTTYATLDAYAEEAWKTLRAYWKRETGTNDGIIGAWQDSTAIFTKITNADTGVVDVMTNFAVGWKQQQTTTAGATDMLYVDKAKVWGR